MDEKDDLNKRDDPNNEGHTKEWQDRARVVLDAKEAANKDASPNQSPVEENEMQDKDERRKKSRETKRDDRFY